jgi:hypothetical protein
VREASVLLVKRCSSDGVRSQSGQLAARSPSWERRGPPSGEGVGGGSSAGKSEAAPGGENRRIAFFAARRPHPKYQGERVAGVQKLLSPYKVPLSRTILAEWPRKTPERQLPGIGVSGGRLRVSGSRPAVALADRRPAASAKTPRNCSTPRALFIPAGASRAAHRVRTSSPRALFRPGDGGGDAPTPARIHFCLGRPLLGNAPRAPVGIYAEDIATATRLRRGCGYAIATPVRTPNGATSLPNDAIYLISWNDTYVLFYAGAGGDAILSRNIGDTRARCDTATLPSLG